MTSEKFTGRRIIAENKVWPLMTSIHVSLASWLPVSAVEALGLNFGIKPEPVGWAHLGERGCFHLAEECLYVRHSR
jgi:hypothetical protein